MDALACGPRTCSGRSGAGRAPRGVGLASAACCSGTSPRASTASSSHTPTPTWSRPGTDCSSSTPGCPPSGRTCCSRSTTSATPPDRVEALLLTHGHFDHVGTAARMHREWGTPRVRAPGRPRPRSPPVLVPTAAEPVRVRRRAPRRPPSAQPDAARRRRDRRRHRRGRDPGVPCGRPRQPVDHRDARAHRRARGAALRGPGRGDRRRRAGHLRSVHRRDRPAGRGPPRRRRTWRPPWRPSTCSSTPRRSTSCRATARRGRAGCGPRSRRRGGRPAPPEARGPSPRSGARGRPRSPGPSPRSPGPAPRLRHRGISTPEVPRSRHLAGVHAASCGISGSARRRARGSAGPGGARAAPRDRTGRAATHRAPHHTGSPGPPRTAQCVKAKPIRAIVTMKPAR
ncbi:MBL fold metallo-hydrolase [Curtobacterium sp. MCPF17_052]|uniref:MBL fold metallo-hydrolase n=1 Tax=Curtobacterium sp. MCPF17_052 TaxID=2175655 RepID=UPI003464A415